MGRLSGSPKRLIPAPGDGLPSLGTPAARAPPLPGPAGLGATSPQGHKPQSAGPGAPPSSEPPRSHLNADGALHAMTQKVPLKKKKKSL